MFSCFNAVFDVNWNNIKLIFIVQDVYRMVIKGRILGSCHFWGDPYLNSTTVLFDILHMKFLAN